MTDTGIVRYRPLNPLALYLLAVLIGVIAGLGAVGFRVLIAIFHNLLFLGKFSIVYDANLHTPASPWGPFVILVPVIGALAVAFLVQNFAPEAKGHGVPEVMDAIYYAKGHIRPGVAVIKAFASAISIGSGGAIGREGPIIQIGSSFGSTMGQILRIPIWQRITLIAAGAGGGIAATFNTPIGGLLFAVEIVLHEFSVRTLVPVAISAATATYVGRLFFGLHPSFVIPSLEVPYFELSGSSPLVLIAYAILGIILGVVSTLYIKSIYAFEDFFEEHIKKSYYLRHATGMLLVGIIFYILLLVSGHYYVEGVGYSTVQDVLSGKLTCAPFLLLLFVLKLFVTSVTLGSGASGGVFSPALYLGATIGASYGIFLKWLIPHLTTSPVAFAVAGMAGVVGGSTGAAMAAIVMIFEMTLDYSVIIPMTITVALSYGIRRNLLEESIYTLKLVRRGHYIPTMLQANTFYLRRAKEIMDPNISFLSPAATWGEFVETVADQNESSWFVVGDDQTLSGVLSRDSGIRAARLSGKQTPLGTIASQEYITITADATVFTILARMQLGRASVALVTRDGENNSVQGIITKECLTDSIVESIDLFSD